MGRAAINSMKKYKNYLILKRWIKIILSIYKCHEDYQKLRNEDVEEEIIETFKKFDQDNNGLIGPEDIYNLLHSLHIPLLS